MAKAQKKKNSPQRWKLYSVSGNKLERKNKFCPKCADSFLAKHKDRLTCGKCGYVEIITK